MAETISKQMTEAIARVAWELLDERHGDRTLLGPIAAIPDVDHCGREYVRIHIGYSRKFDMLEPSHRPSFTDLIMPYLSEMGVETVPSDFFIRNRSWSEWLLWPHALPENATVACAEDLKVFNHTHSDSEFLLEPLSKSAVRVTLRDQTGYFGIPRDWEDDLNPYTSTRRVEEVHGDGIGGINVNHLTPDEALASRCTVILDAQVEEDATRTRSGRWQESASGALQEFLEGLPG